MECVLGEKFSVQQSIEKRATDVLEVLFFVQVGSFELIFLKLNYTRRNE